MQFQLPVSGAAIKNNKYSRGCNSSSHRNKNSIYLTSLEANLQEYKSHNRNVWLDSILKTADKAVLYEHILGVKKGIQFSRVKVVVDLDMAIRTKIDKMVREKDLGYSELYEFKYLHESRQHQETVKFYIEMSDNKEERFVKCLALQKVEEEDDEV